MNITTINQNLKIVIFGLAIAVCTTSFKPVWAENDYEFVPEIGWNSRLSSMGLDEDENIGKKYTFDCQPASEDLIHAPIWGTSVYTVNSGICSTAVHSGMISPEEGGEVTVKLLKGKNFYTGSNKNNVTSRDHRSTDLSYTFVGEKTVTNQTLAESPKKKRESSAIERMLMDGFQRGVERSIERTITDILN